MAGLSLLEPSPPPKKAHLILSFYLYKVLCISLLCTKYILWTNRSRNHRSSILCSRPLSRLAAFGVTWCHITTQNKWTLLTKLPFSDFFIQREPHRSMYQAEFSFRRIRCNLIKICDPKLGGFSSLFGACVLFPWKIRKIAYIARHCHKGQFVALQLRASAQK